MGLGFNASSLDHGGFIDVLGGGESGTHFSDERLAGGAVVMRLWLRVGGGGAPVLGVGVVKVALQQ